MRRVHRIWHLRIWLVLAPLLAAGLYVALRLRYAPARESTSSVLQPASAEHGVP